MSGSTSRTRRRRRPWYRRVFDLRTRRRLYWGVVGLLLVGLLVLVVQVQRSVSALRQAASESQLLQTQIAEGDNQGARSTLAALTRSTDRARSSSGGPLWASASRIPVVGRNLEAVRTVANALDDVATDALPPVVDVAGQVNAKSFSPRDGRIDLPSLVTIGPAVVAANRSLVEASKALSAVDAEGLFVPLRAPVRTVTARVAAAQQVTESGAYASELLPQMLGGEGKRRYLLLVQNNAEVRSTGGIVGAFALIDANRGKMTVARTGNVRDLGVFSDPVIKPTQGELGVYSTSMFTDLRDTTFTPDFPRTAQIAQRLVEEGLGTSIDGVMSIDPVALGYVLEGTGGVELSAGFEIGPANAAVALLNQVYLAFEDPLLQDAFYADATKRVFQGVSSGQGDPGLTIRGLVRAVDEGRLMVWSARDVEQDTIAQTGLSGALVGDDGAVPHLGVYLNDGASTKMEYYLDFDSSARSVRCIDGRQRMMLRTQLSSSAPDKLAKAVTGDGAFAPRGTMLLNVRLYAPYQGYFTSVWLDGEPLTVYADRQRGRTVTRATVRVKPGQSRLLEAEVVTGPGQTDDGVLSSTPGIRSRPQDQSISSSC